MLALTEQGKKLHSLASFSLGREQTAVLWVFNKGFLQAELQMQPAEGCSLKKNMGGC